MVRSRGLDTTAIPDIGGAVHDALRTNRWCERTHRAPGQKTKGASLVDLRPCSTPQHPTAAGGLVVEATDDQTTSPSTSAFAVRGVNETLEMSYHVAEFRSGQPETLKPGGHFE